MERQGIFNLKRVVDAHRRIEENSNTKTANRIINVWDNDVELKYSQVDGEELASVVSGMKILHTEPIDYPLTDGVIIYLQDKDRLVALQIDWDPYIDQQSDEAFKIAIALIP